MKERSYILFYSTFIFFLLQSVNSFGQQKTILEQSKSKDGLGEGVIVITLYSADSQNYRHIDTTRASNFRLKTFYLIKGNLILRPEMRDNRMLMDNDKPVEAPITYSTTEGSNGSKITSGLSASIRNPKILIDWKKKKYYTFFSKEKKPHVSVYSENEQHIEHIYTIHKPDTTSFKILSLDETKSFVVSGFNCFQGVGISHADTLYFAYTKELKKIKSPLNLAPFFKEFPYDVISFSGPSSGSEGTFTGSTHVVTRRWPTLVTATVTYLKERKLDDSLFKIPKGTTVLKNVPNKEIQNYEIKDRMVDIPVTGEPVIIKPTIIETVEEETTESE